MTHIGAQELKRALLGPKLPACAALIAAVFFLDRLDYPYAFDDVLSMMKSASSYKDVLPVIAALPYGASFARDFNSGAYKSLTLRSGVYAYLRAKLGAMVWAMLLTHALAQLLIFLIGWARLPLCLDIYGTYRTYGGYFMGGLLRGGHAALFLAMQTVCSGCLYALYACVCAWASALLPNPIFAACAPLIANYLLVYGCWYAGLPGWLNVEWIERGYITTAFGQDAAILLSILLLAYLFGRLFIRVARRRIQHA